MTLPGMLYGRIVRPPHNFAGLISLDDSKVKSMPGFTAIVRDGGLSGSLRARDVAISPSVPFGWRRPGERSIRRPGRACMAQGARGRAPHHQRERNVEAKSRDVKVFGSVLYQTYISHASIGPSCAIAQIDAGKLVVWSHSQGIFNLRRDLALALGMREDAIIVRHAEGAGCYGHNGADDARSTRPCSRERQAVGRSRCNGCETTNSRGHRAVRPWL